MLENHEQLSAYLDQARSRSSLVGVLIHKGGTVSNGIVGRVGSVGLNGVELSVRDTDGVIIYFNFRGADIRHCRGEKSFESWKVQSPGDLTFEFFELPQQKIAA